MPHLFPSDSPTCPESIRSGSRRGGPRGSLAGQSAGVARNAQGISGNDGAGSRVSVSVSRGAAVGSPALTQAQGPRQSHTVGPVQPHWPHSQKHLPAKAPGRAAGRPKAAGPGTLSCHLSLVSRAWAAPGPQARPWTQSGWICFSGNPVF